MLRGALDAATSGELGCYQNGLLLLPAVDDRATAARPGRRRCKEYSMVLVGA
jgi:hypothetical protein